MCVYTLVTIDFQKGTDLSVNLVSKDGYKNGTLTALKTHNVTDWLQQQPVKWPASTIFQPFRVLNFLNRLYLHDGRILTCRGNSAIPQEEPVEITGSGITDN